MCRKLLLLCALAVVIVTVADAFVYQGHFVSKNDYICDWDVKHEKKMKKNIDIKINCKKEIKGGKHEFKSILFELKNRIENLNECTFYKESKTNKESFYKCLINDLKSKNDIFKIHEINCDKHCKEIIFEKKKAAENHIRKIIYEKIEVDNEDDVAEEVNGMPESMSSEDESFEFEPYFY